MVLFLHLQAGYLLVPSFLSETTPEALSPQLPAPILYSLLLSMEIHVGQMFLAHHWAVTKLEGGVSVHV